MGEVGGRPCQRAGTGGSSDWPLVALKSEGAMSQGAPEGLRRRRRSGSRLPPGTSTEERRPTRALTGPVRPAAHCPIPALDCCRAQTCCSSDKDLARTGRLWSEQSGWASAPLLGLPCLLPQRNPLGSATAQLFSRRCTRGPGSSGFVRGHAEMVGELGRHSRACPVLSEVPDAAIQPLRHSNKCVSVHTCMSVHVCAVCVRVCMCVHVCERAWARECACVRACVPENPQGPGHHAEPCAEARPAPLSGDRSVAQGLFCPQPLAGPQFPPRAQLAEGCACSSAPGRSSGGLYCSHLLWGQTQARPWLHLPSRSL